MTLDKFGYDRSIAENGLGDVGTSRAWITIRNKNGELL